MSDFIFTSDDQKLPFSVFNSQLKRLLHQIDALYLSLESDKTQLEQLQEIKLTASTLIDQFEEQKKNALKQFSHHLLPVVNDILEDLLLDRRKFIAEITEKSNSSVDFSQEFWIKEKEKWKSHVDLWSDLESLIRKVLEAVADRSAKLIDKDIQIIQDYQTQSLSHFSIGSEVFKSLEMRLAHAVAEPLKQLMGFKNQVKEQKSMEQVSEWVSKLQEQRESYFEQLLMRIDLVVKDWVDFEDTKAVSSFEESESEVIFLERECDQVMENLEVIFSMSDCDRQFLLARSEEIAQHALELENLVYSKALKRRLKSIHEGVVSKLESINPLQAP